MSYVTLDIGTVPPYLLLVGVSDLLDSRRRYCDSRRCLYLRMTGPTKSVNDHLLIDTRDCEAKEGGTGR